MEQKSIRSSNSTVPAHRLRILGTENQSDLIREMAEIGVDPAGIELMTPKGQIRAIRLAQLPPWNSNLLKQEMLSLGGEAAVHRGAIDCSASRSDVLLLGTKRHFSALLEKLRRQPPSMRRLGEEIGEALGNYERRNFTLRLGGSEILLGDRTLIMGVVNISPDSFYDGGKHFSVDGAVEHAMRLVDEGADIIDVGGESSRPGAEPVPLDEERRRVLPVIEKLTSRTERPLSVDTYKSEVARDAIAAGATMVNDISALRFDREMAGVVAGAGAGLIVMHMKGEPRTMQSSPEYGNVMAEIVEELRQAVDAAVEAGVDREQILVDPGIGFGKKLEHNLTILRHLSELRVLGRPVVVGPSRKAFIGVLNDVSPEDRLEGTLAAVCMAAAAGAAVVRVHDVLAVRRALEVADAVGRGAA